MQRPSTDALPSAVREAPAEHGSSPARALHRALLVLLVLTWAISWPAIKAGVSVVPPLWYGCLRYALASGCLFALVAARRELALPARSDWPLVGVSAVFQMSAFSALSATALTILPPGRASVLAYSTPIWVMPLSAWWLRERLSRPALLGVILGVLGALAIAAPSLRPTGRRELLAYGMLVGAAAAWAISIVFVRRHRFAASALALAPWQTLAAAVLLLPVAALLEGGLPPIGPRGAASLAYVGPIATAFGYWAVVEAGRRFRATTMSMALLAVPGLGIPLSVVTHGETIGPSLVMGVLLIGAGIRLATGATAARALTRAGGPGAARAARRSPSRSRAR